MMIIWINGAFGSGKTQTAFELHRRLENSYVYDPENIGYFIRDNIPLQMKKADFQDYAQWRKFNYEMLEYIAKNYDGIVIVPMTITNPSYYEEIIGSLKSHDIDIRHFILSADKKTLFKRLRKRLESKNSWAANQIDRCINAFDKSIPGIKINTMDINIYSVTERIANECGIMLQPDKRNPLKKHVDRIITQIRHIR